MAPPPRTSPERKSSPERISSPERSPERRAQEVREANRLAEAKRQAEIEKKERAEANRLALEAERHKELAERSRQAQQQAEEARKARAKAEENRQKQATEALRQLQAKWADADKKIDDMRDEAFAQAGGRVAAWASRRAAAHIRNADSDETHKKRMHAAFVKKDERFQAWVVDTEAERARKAKEMALVRASAAVRFEGEVNDRSLRLKEAQQLAARRRRAKEEEKRVQLAELAEKAEQRDREAWEARVRVEKAHRQREERLAAECKKKEKQASDFLQKRYDEIEKIRSTKITRAQSSSQLRVEASCWRL